MQLDPTNSTNYNGFVHPNFLDYLSPSIEDMPVKIDGVIVPNSNATEWAKNGMLDEINLFTATTSYESLIIKGKGRQLADFIRDHPETDQSLLFLDDYYSDDSSKSMEAFLKQLRRPSILARNIGVFVSICIQDFGFDNTSDIKCFLMENMNSTCHTQTKYSISYSFNHYLRDPDDIRDYEEAGSLACQWVFSAIYWAQIADFGSTRKSLEHASRMAGKDCHVWRNIALMYLYLLGDFEQFAWATKRNIERCNSARAFRDSAGQLCAYRGTPEAIEHARELMHYAELSAKNPKDLNGVAKTWECYLKDPERGSKCRKIADIQKQAMGA